MNRREFQKISAASLAAVAVLLGRGSSAAEGAAGTYVEISGRQTGKTYRMRQFVKEKLKEGKSVRVHTVIPDLELAHYAGLRPDCPPPLATSDFSKTGGVDVEVFDEWDCASAYGFGHAPFVAGGYYTTTLLNLRDPRPEFQDDLFRLLVGACDEVVNYRWSEQEEVEWSKFAAVLRPAQSGAIFEDPVTGAPRFGPNPIVYTFPGSPY
jgi:hypothetical protein